MRTWAIWSMLVLSLVSVSRGLCEETPGDIPGMPVKGMVTMLDIGKGTCIPCRMMAPILEKLKKEYKGKAEIVFVDISSDLAPAVRHGIRAIPTQIFFNKDGKEVYRHVGFFPEDAIVQQLDKMGVHRPL